MGRQVDWNWAWWFSWAPFAGLFLATLSCGRTIRTIVFTSLIATSTATMTRFLLVGATALHTYERDTPSLLESVQTRLDNE